MTSRPRLHSILHFLVELTFILIVAAVFGLLIYHSNSSLVTVIE